MDKTNKLIQKASQYLGKRDFAHAENILRKVLKKQKFHLDANYLLGTLLAEKGQLDLAIKYLKTAQELNPNSPYIYNNLGALYKNLSQLTLAAQHFERALAIKPDMSDAHFNLATIRNLSGDPDAALIHFQQAQRDPKFGEQAIAGIASCYNRSGKHAEAEALLKPFYIKPAKSQILLKCLADHLRHQKKSSDVIQAVANQLSDYLASKVGNSRVDLCALYFGLGHLEDKLGNTEKAFQAYSKANSLKLRIGEVIDYPSLFLSAAETLSHPVPAAEGSGISVIFIIGMPRSGSTLIEQILHAHGKTLALGECDYFGAALDQCGLSRACAPDDLSGDGGEHVKAIYLKLAGASDPDALIVDKTLHNYFHMGQILQVFPRARFVISQRDAFSTCMSGYFHDFVGQLTFTYSLQELGRMYNSVEKILALATQRFASQVHVVDYETLVEAPEQEIRKLIGYSGLEWDPACLDFYQAKRHVTTSSAQQVTKPIYSDSLHRYDRYRDYVPELTAILEQNLDHF